MERILIDRNEILDILDDKFSFWEYARDVIARNGLDEYEDEMLHLCDDILEGFKNFAEFAEVIEERKTTTCICSVQKEDTYDCLYDVYYYTCENCFESVKTETEEENFKFCPYCGAKYEKIVRY